MKDRRYIGLLTDGTEGYEFACADGKGFIAKVDAKGAIAANLDCTKLNGGGCTLTDTRAATAEQAGLYSRLAKLQFGCGHAWVSRRLRRRLRAHRR